MEIDRGQFSGCNCTRWELSGGQLAYVAIVRGAIILGAVFRGVNNPGENCSKTAFGSSERKWLRGSLTSYFVLFFALHIFMRGS